MSKEPKVPKETSEPTTEPKIVTDSYGVMSAMLKIEKDENAKLVTEVTELKGMVAKMTQIIEDEQKSGLISQLMRTTSIPPEYLATMDLKELEEAKKYTLYARPSTFVSGGAVGVDKPAKINLNDKFSLSMTRLRAGDYKWPSIQ